eukprot:2829040-Pleurochrysis_carterae.AAC.1
MEEHHRVRVTKYLDSIGCPLDIRAKRQRNPEQKWFSVSSNVRPVLLWQACVKVVPLIVQA